MIIYVEHVLSSLGRVRLASESILKIVPPTALSKKEILVFFARLQSYKTCTEYTGEIGVDRYPNFRGRFAKLFKISSKKQIQRKQCITGDSCCV